MRMLATLDEVDVSEPANGSRVPLVLIHDGGGTTFQYHMLGTLGRHSYAVANPYFNDGAEPPGGIRHLAEEYAAAIEDTLKGPVIIGGWFFDPRLKNSTPDCGSLTRMELRMVARWHDRARGRQHPAVCAAGQRERSADDRLSLSVERSVQPLIRRRDPDVSSDDVRKDKGVGLAVVRKCEKDDRGVGEASHV